MQRLGYPNRPATKRSDTYLSYDPQPLTPEYNAYIHFHFDTQGLSKGSYTIYRENYEESTYSAYQYFSAQLQSKYGKPDMKRASPTGILGWIGTEKFRAELGHLRILQAWETPETIIVHEMLGDSDGDIIAEHTITWFSIPEFLREMCRRESPDSRPVMSEGGEMSGDCETAKDARLQELI